MTPTHDCEQLDAYLVGDLRADQAARFESHLESCAECREAAAQQQWIDDLLRSPTAQAMEVPSPGLLSSVRSTFIERKRRSLRAVYGLAAAAVLLLAAGWFALQRSHKQEGISVTTDIAAVPADGSKGAQTPATFVATTDAIVVPLESTSDEVTVVQVYQTTDAERRWRIEQSLSNLSANPNGG